jgi:hypothetical protein
VSQKQILDAGNRCSRRAPIVRQIDGTGSTEASPVSRKEIWFDPIVHRNERSKLNSNPSKLGFRNPYQRKEQRPEQTVSRCGSGEGRIARESSSEELAGVLG